MNTKCKGFTFVELLIAITIVGISASLCYPTYQRYIQKIKRIEAQTILITMANSLEQWRVQNNNDYTGVTANTIYSDRIPTDKMLTKTYTLGLVSDATSYTITATPEGVQVNDDCGVMTLNSVGTKTATKYGVTVANCWEQ